MSSQIIKENDYAIVKVLNEDVIVDLSILDKIKTYTWHLGKNFLISTSIGSRKIYLHRLISNATKDQLVFFKDKNRLNCRVSNLDIRPKKGPPNIFRSDSKTTIITAYYKKTYPYDILIDTFDLELVSKYRWHICKRKNYILVRGVHKELKGYTVDLYRLLVHCEADKVIDHVDRNPLNNRRANLRAITKTENSQNISSKPKRNGLPRNVIKTSSGKYSAYISLGTYETKEKALIAAKNFRALHYPWSAETRGQICECLKDVLPKGIGSNDD